MRRIDVRTPGAWRSYDLWSGILALLFPLALAVLWAAGVSPPFQSCCAPAKVAAVAPVVAARPAPAAVAPPAPVALVQPDVEFISADGKVTLKGRNADDRTREVLVSDARRDRSPVADRSKARALI